MIVGVRPAGAPVHEVDGWWSRSVRYLEAGADPAREVQRAARDAAQAGQVVVVSAHEGPVTGDGPLTRGSAWLIDLLDRHATG